MGENNIIILSFSGRKNGNCAQIAKFVQSLTGGKTHLFSDLDIRPCGQCGGECFRRGPDCPHIADDVYSLYDAVARCSRAVFILPNHCDYPNANFFAFNERSLCFFSKRQDLLEAYGKIPKKFIVLSGGEKENFRSVLSQHCDGEPDILFLRAADYGKKSIAGDLMTVPEVAAQIKTFLHEERPTE